MTNTFAEKRRFPRLKIASPLHYQIRGLAKTANTLINNISLGGIGFIDNQFIPPNTPIMLEMNLLSRPLRPAGKIAWSSPIPHSDRYYSGVEFTEFSSEEKKYLQDYLDMQMGKL